MKMNIPPNVFKIFVSYKSYEINVGIIGPYGPVPRDFP